MQPPFVNYLGGECSRLVPNSLILRQPALKGTGRLQDDLEPDGFIVQFYTANVGMNQIQNTYMLEHSADANYLLDCYSKIDL
jgi:hypothetical protein